MGIDWTIKEVDLIIEDYFRMLQIELEQLPYNKTHFRQNLILQLNDRSNGSIEFKHQNISAVLANMGLPFIKGYKPKVNYQHILEERVAKFLQANRLTLEKNFEAFSDSSFVKIPLEINFSTVLSDSPQVSELQEREPTYKPIKINYLEREQNNRKLGEQGEELVMQYEKFRLIEKGKGNLADKIEWVSKTKGDGTGFDILSKNFNGTDRFIEVKTTKLTKETPIYLTKTEVSFASLKSKDFYLYRVFNFNTTPQIFIKNGEYKTFCQLISQSYKGYF